MPVPPLPGPGSGLEITVKIQPNSEYITPLELGNITYQYPTQFTTDKISEIVVSGAAVTYSRFQAIYGPEPVLQLSRSVKQSAADEWSFQGQIPASSLKTDFDQQVYDSGGLLYVTPDNVLQTPVKSGALNNVDTPSWGKRTSSVYYPQLDFFPRYNQWFASTMWTTPFDPENLVTPIGYLLNLIYVDRVAKQVYYKEAIARFEVVDGVSGERQIELNGGSLTRQGPGSSIRYLVSLTGRSYLPHPSLKATVWRFDLLLNDSVAASQTTNGVFPTARFAVPFTFDFGNVVNDGVNKVQVRATSLDPAALVTTSNSIYIAG